MTIKELFSDPAKWTQRTYAKTKEGVPVQHYHPDAVCWCLHGATYKCYPTEWARVIHVLDKTSDKLFKHSAVGVNDELGYDAVMRVVEEAGV